MAFLESALIFIVALAVVVKSSHWVLDASLKIASLLGVADFAVGYVLIAAATSLPDFMVSVIASSSGAGSIALGDVLGSSIANICLVLGISAMFRRISVKREQTIESAELLFIVAIIPLLLLYRGALGPLEGAALLLVFLMYLLFVAKKGFSLNLHSTPSRVEVFRTLMFFAFGMVLLVFSARFLVNSAIELASGLNIPQALVGLTVISFGTTLPALMVDFAAIRRGKIALALGDIFGSCVINLTLVLGAASMFGPINNGIEFFTTGFIFLVAATVFIWYILMKHEGISRRSGLILILGYVIYIMTETIVALAKSSTGG